MCKKCQENQYKKIIKEKKEAMKRYTDKIRKEKKYGNKDNNLSINKPKK